MRKKKILLTGTLLFMSWGTIQLYLFVHKPQYQIFRSPRSWFSGLQSNGSQSTEAGPPSAEGGANGGASTPAALSAVTPSSLFDFKAIASKVDSLEHDLSRQIKSNEGMLRVLRIVNRIAKKTGKSVQEVLKNKEYLDSLSEGFIGKEPVIAVLLFACNRVTVKRNLDQLFKFRPPGAEEIFPIVVTQDCNHDPTRQIIQSYGSKLKYIQQPDQSDIVLHGKAQKKFKGYYKISRHYGWALNHTFNELNYNTVLIVEDDLDISPDFFEYFLALYPILKSDPTIYCVSAWNDNGKDGIVEQDPTKLYRSDFFPGLGWMLTKDLWMEFQNKWPKAFWDDWIREPEQRKNRVCIRPELSRTKTFGKKGVSNGLFYEKHLKFIKLNEKFVPFTQMNLTYLLKENYDVEFLKAVYNSRQVGVSEMRSLPVAEAPAPSSAPVDPIGGNRKSVRIQYNSRDQFKKAAKVFGLMDDFKCGVPRTGYQGVVSFMHRGYRVYLSPSPLWTGYNITWK